MSHVIIYIMKRNYFLIGIDEAGRGPLAGPVAVGAVAMTSKPRFLRGIRDSKKLSAKQRQGWATILYEKFECHCALIGPKTIDKIGIQKALRLATTRVLQRFDLCPDLVLLDGAMAAPKYYKQKTIIKGDEKVPIISAASIIAKTTRDAAMLKLHKKFPKYCFDKHKGYGTKLHYKMLKKNGFSPIHRRSFCKNCKN